MNQSYMTWRLTFSVIATIGLYSVLYKENKFYRFFEHLFLGLAAGWTMVALWTETLYSQWWSPMVGAHVDAAGKGTAAPGYWAYMMLLPIGLMAYFVYSRKHNWISRIPIGIILGFWSGQQVQVWWNRYGPQISDSMKPIFPNTFNYTDTAGVVHFSLTTPPSTATAVPAGALYGSSAVSNLIFVLTFVCALSYFLFSFDVKHKLLGAMSTAGRWLLMVGFGAIFGSTVMMRFTLLIDRMYFVWIEWLRDRIIPLFFHHP